MTTTFTTFTGKQVDPFSLESDQVDIIDIAHSLSLICRFGGHSQTHYSVATHSIRVAAQVSRELSELPGIDQWVLTGLMHDATEAYLLDLIRPMKHRPEMGFYRETEAKVYSVIAAKYGFIDPMPDVVHAADEWVLRQELEHDRYAPNGQSPEFAERQFLRMFDRLTGYRWHREDVIAGGHESDPG